MDKTMTNEEAWSIYNALAIGEKPWAELELRLAFRELMKATRGKEA
jgi:hypothetical protein